MKSSLLSLLVIFGLSATLLSCGGEVQKASFSAPSEDDGDGGDGGGDDDGTLQPPSPIGFYVKPVASEWPVTTLMHKFYDRAMPCMVTKGTVNPANDISCILNIREADLFYSDVKWELNVPAGMCNYMRETPYQYWNGFAGFGPKNIAITVNAASPPAITACTVDGVTVTPSGTRCNFPNSEGYILSSGDKRCVYDHGSSGIGNCCQGAVTTQITSPTDVSVAEGTWGGKIGNCLNGSFKAMEWPVTENSALPVKRVTQSGEGFSKTIKIPRTVGTMMRSSNLTVANFYGWTQYAAGNHAAAPLPFANTHATDETGDVIGAGTMAYQYECLDQAGGLNARVRVYVNEWDTSENFVAYVAGSTTVSPTNNGNDHIDCKNDGVESGSCNDFEDWKTPNFDPTAELPEWATQQEP